MRCFSCAHRGPKTAPFTHDHLIMIDFTDAAVFCFTNMIISNMLITIRGYLLHFVLLKWLISLFPLNEQFEKRLKM